MIRWTSERSLPSPRRWQSRQEILKAHLDSLTPDQLLRVRPDYWAVRFGPASRAKFAYKYDSNQPRDDHGRWINADGDGSANRDKPPSSGIMAARQRANEADCDSQYKLDTFKCNLVRTPLCWAAANERYAACLSGRHIPQLRF